MDVKNSFQGTQRIIICLNEWEIIRNNFNGNLLKISELFSCINWIIKIQLDIDGIQVANQCYENRSYKNVRFMWLFWTEKMKMLNEKLFV